MQSQRVLDSLCHQGLLALVRRWLTHRHSVRIHIRQAFVVVLCRGLRLWTPDALAPRPVFVSTADELLLLLLVCLTNSQAAIVHRHAKAAISHWHAHVCVSKVSVGTAGHAATIILLLQLLRQHLVLVLFH